MNESILNALAVGQLHPDWNTVGRLKIGVLSTSERVDLQSAMLAFMEAKYIRLRDIEQRLLDVGFPFLQPEAARLRRATEADIQALDALINDHGPVPLSLECWYRTIGSFSFAPSGERMFDKDWPFYFFHQYLRMAMPPADAVLTTRWDAAEDIADADDSMPDPVGLILVDEFSLDEDCRAVQLPDTTIDPVIESGCRYLSWVDAQCDWGGFGTLGEILSGKLSRKSFPHLDLECVCDIFGVAIDQR